MCDYTIGITRDDVPVMRSACLRFVLFSSSGVRGRRTNASHAVHAVRVARTSTSDAGSLPAVAICSATLATAADSNGSASVMAEHIPAPRALIVLLARNLHSIR